jgi:hypothetical protein
MHIGWRTIGSGRSIIGVLYRRKHSGRIIQVDIFCFKDLLILQWSTTVGTDSVSRQCVPLCGVSFFLYCIPVPSLYLLSTECLTLFYRHWRSYMQAKGGHGKVIENSLN